MGTNPVTSYTDPYALQLRSAFLPVAQPGGQQAAGAGWSGSAARAVVRFGVPAARGGGGGQAGSGEASGAVLVDFNRPAALAIASTYAQSVAELEHVLQDTVESVPLTIERDTAFGYGERRLSLVAKLYERIAGGFEGAGGRRVGMTFSATA